jgi:hypothetical protein
MGSISQIHSKKPGLGEKFAADALNHILCG